MMRRTIRAAATLGIAAMVLLAAPAAADEFAEDRAEVERLMAEIEAVAGAQPGLKPVLENRETAWAAYAYRDDGYDLTSVGLNWTGTLSNGESPGSWIAGVILEAEGTDTGDVMAGGYAAALTAAGLYAEARALAGDDRWLAKVGAAWDVATLGPVTVTPFAGGTYAGKGGESLFEGQGGVEVSTAWGPVSLSTSAAAVVDDELDVSGTLGAGAAVEWGGLGLGIDGSYDTASGDIGGTVTGRMAF